MNAVALTPRDGPDAVRTETSRVDGVRTPRSHVVIPRFFFKNVLRVLVEVARSFWRGYLHRRRVAEKIYCGEPVWERHRRDTAATLSRGAWALW